jgi:flagellar basal-body rod protein FlgG
MQIGYYNSAAGMVMQFDRLNMIANNLANVNTAGFKEDSFIVGNFSTLYNKIISKKESSCVATPMVARGFTDFRLGDIHRSENYLDFALAKKDLFFAIKTPNGIRLTRDGSFKIDEQGNLVTKYGYKVLQNDFFSKGTNVNIKDNKELKNIMVIKVDNLFSLKKEGANLYIYEKLDRSNVFNNPEVLLQGFIEKSNVNAVKMMTQMIEANRLVEMYQKVMDVHMNEMNRDAIQKIASTK